MLTFTASRGQIPVAIVRNNYLNNWAFKEKIDCLKAVFCGESIRGNHFSWLLDIVFLLISTRKDAWFFGFLLLCRWPVWWTMLREEKSSDEQFRSNLWFTVAIYIYISQAKEKKKKSSFNRCPEINVCGTTGSSELTVMSWLEKNGARLTVKVCVCVGWGGAVSDWNSMASSLYSQSLISTYSVHALHTARRGEEWEAAEGYLPDKLLGDTTASFIVGHEARQAGRAPSS